ncbi:MAG: hypothetical protein CVU59_00580 [Deltaproteobacteria bacterium HGW-Deltaproteobacteria-17]|nr:MAG: hypothetical protein CVU59_00580 [Deltaproteobacteria bacterium HGW-Deltaproteobacteria-17]
MKRFTLLTTLLATLGFFSGCNSSDSIITCDRYDQWMASCSNCSTTLSCENNYDSLAPTVQLDLDDCADNVLMNNLGICGDWTGDVQYCVDLGADYLGIVCDVGPYCGDGTCDAGEDEVNCAVDCEVASYCGDGVCDANEDEVNCAADCYVSVCDDGVCDLDEDPVACPQDCAYIVCDEYQDWLEGCFTDCTALDTCDAEYGVLDAAVAQDVWDCSTLLSEAALDGLCADNIDGVCDIMLEDELGSFGQCLIP